MEEDRPDFEDDADLGVFPEGVPTPFPFVEQPKQQQTEPDPPTLDEEFPDDSYQDLLGLMWLGHLEHQFRYGGHHFAIRTLKLGEELAVTQVIDEYKDTLGLGKAGSAATVAACLELVDGQPLVERLGRDDAVSTIRDKFQALIDEETGWYWGVIEHIFNEYSILQIRQAEIFERLRSK